MFNNNVLLDFLYPEIMFQPQIWIFMFKEKFTYTVFKICAFASPIKLCDGSALINALRVIIYCKCSYNDIMQLVMRQ